MMSASLPTTSVYAVRHGETEWNLAGRAQGHLDSPLTETGRAQAELLAEGLTGKGIEVIVTSDLGRAVDTCRAIAEKLGLDFATDPGLRERHLGSMQGLTHAEFAEQHPEAFAVYQDPTRDVAIPGGESRQEHLERSVRAAEKFIAHHRGRTVLFVCHGGVLDCFLYHTFGLKPGSVRSHSIMNASVNRFEVTGNTWKLITWGDVSHLRAVRALDDQ